MASIIIGCGDDAAINQQLTSGTKLTVKVIPANAAAKVEVSLLSGSSVFEGSAQGEYSISLAPGTYNVVVSAPVYNTLTKNITLGSSEVTETFDLSTGEIQTATAGVNPRVSVNTGTVPMTITGSNFTGTATVVLISGTTEVKTGTSVTVVDPNTMTCNMDITGLPVGELK